MQLINTIKRCGLQLLLGACLTIFCMAAALADGILTHMSGQVSIEKADGSKLVGVPGMQISAGDTLITGEKGFVRIQLTDGGEMVLRPGSHLKIEQYFFDKGKPTDDSFVFNVIKGGFRAISGLISKRGNKDAYKAKTPTAVAVIRGTQYDLRVCAADCGALPPGTYVAVKFGAISTGNAQGNLSINAGQVGFTPPNAPPVQLPRDPGVGFTPPPSIPKLDEKKKLESSKAATTEAPATVTETKAATTEAPATVTETKAATTEAPATVTETKAATTEAPATVTETKAATTEAPATVTETKAATTNTLNNGTTEINQAANNPTANPAGAMGTNCSIQ